MKEGRKKWGGAASTAQWSLRGILGTYPFTALSV